MPVNNEQIGERFCCPARRVADLPESAAAKVGKAAGRGVRLEVDAQPSRLGLTDIHCRRAREAGDVANTRDLGGLGRLLSERR